MKLQPITDHRGTVVEIATVIASLALTSLLVAVLQDNVGVPNASSVYLLAVVVVAVAFGTVAAAATAVGAFLLYDYQFIPPIHTFTVSDPDEWVNLILLLVIGMVVGQLAAGQRNRAQSAEIREREARFLFRVSRALATRANTAVALNSIVDTLHQDAPTMRLRVSLAPDGAVERVTADSDPGEPFSRPATYFVLRRMPGDAPATWVRVHDPAARARPGFGPTPGSAVDAYRIPIEASGRTLGGLWALRPRADRAPSRGDPNARRRGRPDRAGGRAGPAA